MAAKRKRKRGSKERRRRRQGIAVSFLALVVALVWALLDPELQPGSVPAPRADGLRVVSWNLANFSGGSDHDLVRMREIIDELDPDVLAVQEVKSREALVDLLPGWEIALSDAGGRGHQRLGLAFRPERVELLDSAEHRELTLGGRVRPGFSAYLRGRDGGPDFWLVVVHLKAMPDALDQRREQWPVLADLVDRLGPDRDVVVVGDFNTTGPPGSGASGPAREQAELTKVVAGVGLRRLNNQNGCTAYYDGERRDAWKEPSEIDLAWVRGLDEALEADARVFSGTHCAVERCEPFRSTDAYPVRDYAMVSDHCPLVLDLAAADDDP